MDTIQFLSIEGKDYRQYRGEFEIDLEVTDENHINIIEGQNGAGKSNLLNAITLCLYDDEMHIDESDLQAEPLVNHRRLDELDPREAATGYIQIVLGDERPKFIFKRKFTTAKQPDGSYSESSGDLQLKKRIGEDMHEVDNANTELNQILPTSVHEYFLFDGERLDEFFEENYADRVKGGILDVSHIELLNKARKHLKEAQKRIEEKSAKYEGNVKKAKLEYDEARKQLEDLNSEKDQAEEELEGAKERRDEIDEDLRESSDEEVREKQFERERLRNERNDAQEDLEEAIQEAGDALTTAGKIVYNVDALGTGLEHLEELEQQGELPPKIQDWFIERLLERDTCICGEDLNAENRRENLRHLKQEVADIEEGNIEGKIRIPDLLDNVDPHVDDLVSKREQVEDLRDERDQLQDNIEEISAFIEQRDTINAEDAAALEDQRQEINDRIEELNQRIGELKTNIEDQREERDKKKAAWKDKMAKNEKHKILLGRVEFVEEAREEVERIRSNILDQVRNETEDRLQDYFNELIWKDEHYEIQLTDEYEVHVEGPTDEKKLASLSAGERQVLALAFMSALSHISGFDAPIIIDTPLGRISSKPRRRIAAQLPEYLEGRQVTLMVTDEEYTNEVAAFLDDHVANEYELRYENETTKVIPR